MTAPSRLHFQDLLPFARQELEHDQPGGWMRPRLLLFHDSVATIYGRSRLPRPEEGTRDLAAQMLLEMAALHVHARPTQAAAILQCRLTAREVGQDASMDPCATQALLLTRAWRDPDQVTILETTVQTFGRDDGGQLCWQEPSVGVVGPVDDLLTRTIGGGRPLLAPQPSMPMAGLVYALTKFGHVIGVHRDDVQRFGLDQPVAPRLVRESDRAQARRLVRRHRDRQRSTVQVNS